MNKEKAIKIIKNSAAVIVIISLLVIIFYQNRDRDLFKFGKDESSNIVNPSQNGSGGYFIGDVQKMGDDVAYINPTSFNILNEDGEGERVSLTLSEPSLHVKGEFAVFYNKDSLDATVYNRSKKYYSVRSTNKIMCAKVNKNGYLLLVTEKEGYNCECMVYNKNGEPIFKWDISKSEFIDGDINSNNNAIALSLATAGNQKLLGEIVLIDITQAQEMRRSSVDSQLFYKVNFNSNNTCTALGSNCLKYYNSDGSEKWSYDYKGKILSKADISNPDIMVLAFEKSGSGVKGNSTEVKVINRLGKQIGSKSYDYIADDVSVGENSVAIAFGKTIYICDTNLEQRKKVSSESGIEKIALFNDNSHVFVISSSGGKILK